MPPQIIQNQENPPTPPRRPPPRRMYCHFLLHHPHRIERKSDAVQISAKTVKHFAELGHVNNIQGGDFICKKHHSAGFAPFVVSFYFTPTTWTIPILESCYFCLL
jgi:hypothetical protein